MKVRLSKIGAGFKEKVEMYDSLIGNILKGTSIIEPNEKLGMNNLSIGFDSISSQSYISKYFIINEMPDWIPLGILSDMRYKNLRTGVKINYFIYSKKHTIKWESTDMKNKMHIWKELDKDSGELSNASVFDYRNKRDGILNRKRTASSMRYLNKAELDDRRTLCEVSIVVQISGRRGENGRYLYNMAECIKDFKKYCLNKDIRVKEIRGNVMDWIQYLHPTGMRPIKEVTQKLSRRVMTDDNLANFNSYKQGRVGKKGVPIGMDVYSKSLVLKDLFKAVDVAENWLVSATTSGGKSFFMKHLYFWMLVSGIVVTVIDFEGDEHIKFAYFLKESNPDDAVIVSMGKGNTCYCDPMPIPDLTGVPEIDDDLKETAMNFTNRMVTTIVRGGDGGELTRWQESVLSSTIKDVYAGAGVTDQKETWHRSKNLSLHNLFEELETAVVRKVYIDEDTNNAKHLAAVDLYEALVPYFKEGEAKSGTFKNPLAVESLYKAKFIVFSFGEKGKATMGTDTVLLQLKQLSVANISSQISNYQKYVKKRINAKIWEEYNRYGEIKGSAQIIKNAITGGRKRGDFNIISTNDLNAMLIEDGISGEANSAILNNITTFCIGKLKDKDLIERFCTRCQLPDLREPLRKISVANSKNGSRYYKSFCVVMDDSDKAIVKVALPESIAKSELFSTDRPGEES